MKGRRQAPRSRPAVIGKGSMLRTPTFWVSVLTLLGIVVFVLGDLGRTAPGPLSSAHERVAALSGFGSGQPVSRRLVRRHDERVLGVPRADREADRVGPGATRQARRGASQPVCDVP